MFCRRCGRKIPSDSDFCPHCGEKVLLDEPASIQIKEPVPNDSSTAKEEIPGEPMLSLPQKETVPPPNGSSPKRKESNARYWILGILIVGILIGLIWNDAKNVPPSAAKTSGSVEEIQAEITDALNQHARRRSLRDFTITFSSPDGIAPAYDMDISCSNWDVFPIASQYAYACQLNEKATQILSEANLKSVSCNGTKYDFDFPNETIFIDGQLFYSNSSNPYLSKSSDSKKSSSQSTPTVFESSSRISDSFGHTTDDAWYTAQQIVSSYLLAPSSAEFCKITESKFSIKGDEWIVSGWVDAQNGFGTMIRYVFVADFTFTASEKYIENACIIE